MKTEPNLEENMVDNEEKSILDDCINDESLPVEDGSLPVEDNRNNDRLHTINWSFHLLKCLIVIWHVNKSDIRWIDDQK